jgi:hypothetical protein
MTPKLSAALIAAPALGVVVWVNAALTDTYCASNPSFPACDNPQTPGPEFPHCLESSPIANGTVTVWGIGTLTR